MMLVRTLRVVAPLFLLTASVLAAESGNSSQHIVPNAAGDTALDQAKVDKYKSLLDQSGSDEIFADPFKWTDILDQYTPLAGCSARCLTCAPGCSPSCCALGDNPEPSGDNANRDISRPRFPRIPGFPNGPFGRPIPIPPLACPCHCESNCPPIVQIVCCFTPGQASGRDPNGGSAADSPTTLKAGVTVDTQQNLLDEIRPLNPPKRIWGHPNHPLACPCFCEPTCPAYIQAVCCFTPGIGIGGRDAPPDQLPDGITKAPKTHDTLAMVTETADGRPVSVLAAVNLTVSDSFITLDLVQGLERASQITYHEGLKIFEIPLNVVLGPEDKEVVLSQTFILIDGSRLLEQEQILLGSAFLSRVGGLNVTKDFLTALQEGLPVLTGLPGTKA